MPDQVTTAQLPRVRAQATQDAKGAFKVEVTVECFQGEDAPKLLAQKVKEVQEALLAQGLLVNVAA